MRHLNTFQIDPYQQNETSDLIDYTDQKESEDRQKPQGSGEAA